MLWPMIAAIVFVSSLYATGWLYAQGYLSWRTAWVPLVGVCAVPLLVHGLNHSDTRPMGKASISALADVSSFAWPSNDNARATAERTRRSPLGGATPQASKSVPPVDSLVQGLRARLEENPDDAAGWALLAQSYAFLGETDLLQGAMQRAISLGLDEATLRQRIEAAAHSPVAATQRTASPAGSLR